MEFGNLGFYHVACKREMVGVFGRITVVTKGTHLFIALGMGICLVIEWDNLLRAPQKLLGQQPYLLRDQEAESQRLASARNCQHKTLCFGRKRMKNTFCILSTIYSRSAALSSL